MDIELPKDYEEFLKLLNANGVKYLLIGGFAVGFHGYPRATYDIDIFVSKDFENANRLIKTLNEFGFEIEGLKTTLFTKDKSIVRMGVEPVKIELANFISGIEFEDAFENRVIGKIGGVEVNLISLNDLKKNKKASGRHKDLNDLEHLS
jgi:predicted nucleotidyltransferase